MAAGRWIYQNLSFISQDPFSFTFSGSNWVSITWGYEVFIYTIYKLLNSHLAVTFVHSLAVFFAAYFTWKTYEITVAARKLNSNLETLISVGLFCLAFYFISPRWHQRPEVFSHLFGSVILYLLFKRKAASSGSLYFFIPLIQVLWVNSHGLFIFGPIFCFLFWITTRRRDFALTTFATSLACLINPRLLEGALYPFHLLKILRDPFFANTIPEAVAPFQGGVWTIYELGLGTWVLLFLIGLMMQVKNRSVEDSDLIFNKILFLGLAFTAFGAIRNVSILILWTLPFITSLTVEALKHIPGTEAVDSRLRARYLFAGFALLMTLVIGLRAKDLHSPMADQMFTEESAEFMTKHGFTKRTFANTEFANFMLFASEDYRSYIDSRFAELYPVSHFRRYMDIKAQPHLFNDEDKKWNFQAVALTHQAAMSKPLIQYLAQRQDWVPAFVDAFVVIFVKTTEAQRVFGNLSKNDHFNKMYQELQNRFSLSKSARALIALSDAQLMVNDTLAAKESLRLAQQVEPESKELASAQCRTNFIVIGERSTLLAKTKEPSSNQNEFQNLIMNTEDQCRLAQKLHRGQDISSAQVLAVIYFNTNRLDKSIETFGQVLRLDRTSYGAHFYLGRAYGIKGNLAETKKHLLEAARLRPYVSDPLTLLSQILEAAGSKDESQFYKQEAEKRSMASATGD